MSGIIGGAGSKSGVVGETEIDYEEGTWTPDASSAGGSSGVVYYGTPSGTWTKIGNVCYFRGTFYINSTGTHSGKPRILGLPFATVSPGSVSLGYWYGLSGSSSLVNYSGNTAGTYIEVFAITGATISSLSDRVDASALWTNKPEIVFSGFYFV